MSQDIDQERRQFVSVAGLAAAATVVAPGAFLLDGSAEAGSRREPAVDKVRYGMFIDTTKCADGCTECVTACEKENGIDLLRMPEGADPEEWDRQRPRWMRTVKVKDRLTGRVSNLPMMCQHCEHPPCVDVCPTGASFRRADGIVMVDRHICIGCRYCMMACPYKARSFIHENVDQQLSIAPRGKGCVESCNFCVHRRDNGENTTACQDACSHGAIVFGDLNDSNSEVSKVLREKDNTQLRADLKLNTSVRYCGI